MQLSLNGPPVFSVSEITKRVKTLFEKEFRRLWVEGEVVNFKRAGSGHLYFSLRDQDATLNCVMFRMQARRADATIVDGAHIRCFGTLTIYEQQGRYQLLVEAVQLGGEGALLLALAELKARLNAEGLFDPQRKKPLPLLPRAVGVITSESGAAIRDILTGIHRRYPARVVLAPARVQGDGAALELIAALAQLQRVPDVDVIIIGRGGGSLQDLWAFNDEQLARAIAACPIPIVSAVGHEVDVALTDLVADRRAATPTAAAELVVPDAGEILLGLATLRERAARALRAMVTVRRERLRATRARLPEPQQQLAARRYRLDDLGQRLRTAMVTTLTKERAQLSRVQVSLQLLHPRKRVHACKEQLHVLFSRLHGATRRIIGRRQEWLVAHRQRLRALSPLAVLERGYAVVRDSQGRILGSAAQVGPGDGIDVRLREGRLIATVDTVLLPNWEEEERS